MLEMPALEPLYGGQFTFKNLVDKTNYFLIPPMMQHCSSFRN